MGYFTKRYFLLIGAMRGFRGGEPAERVCASRVVFRPSGARTLPCHAFPRRLAPRTTVCLLSAAGITGGTPFSRSARADEEVASRLRRKGIKSVLVANKADGPNADVMLGDFARLGLGTPIGVSALRERNIDQVFAAIRRDLDLSGAPSEMPEPQMLVAIVGKRNAGKRTLVNAIAKIYEGEGDRVSVGGVPGT